jgi:hypothetical protein
MNECCPVSCYICKPDHELTFAWVGCYKDDANRDLGEGPKDYGFTPETCADACQAYSYFGLQNGGWCNCGNSYGSSDSYPRLSQGECSLDGGDYYLGGVWTNSVFVILHGDEPEEPEVPEDDEFVCEDNDQCIQDLFNDASFTCDELAADYCEDDTYGADMETCCPVSCYICKPDKKDDEKPGVPDVNLPEDEEPDVPDVPEEPEVNPVECYDNDQCL